MKKSLLSILFVSMFTTAFSQVTFKPGVRIGANLASISNTDLDSRIGISAGIFGELKLGGFYAMQPEIIYNQQGADKAELQYLSIRLTNKFYVVKDKLPIYALLSPGFDVELGGEVTTYSSSTGAGVSLESDISVSGGIGYDFPFGLGVEARYKQGLIDVINSNDPDKRTNAVIQIAAIYKFSF